MVRISCLGCKPNFLHNTKLAQKKLGGNRILAEFYVGILVLRDDLVSAGTNVYEFNALTPRINATT
jgi:hypothetical protein